MLISVVIAEDHDVTRQGLQAVLTNRFEARIAGTTGDGVEVLPLVEEHDPDLLILDLGLPGLRGLEVLKRIDQRDLSVQVVVLSMHEDDAYVVEALRHGASAYVVKGSPMQELLEAIRAAMNGERYLSSNLPDSALDPPDPDQEPSDRYDTLTDRERDVLQLIAEGLTSKEIGERLHISPRTVDKHRQNLKAKLELRNTAELTRFFLEHSSSDQPPLSE
jgi:DNA-binding NarL/FixJ family response regulator